MVAHLQQLQAPVLFRGDHEDLVDHLLFSCHRHKLKAPGSGFGRPLVPYFSDAAMVVTDRCACMVSKASRGRCRASHVSTWPSSLPLQALRLLRLPS